MKKAAMCLIHSARPSGVSSVDGSKTTSLSQPQAPVFHLSVTTRSTASLLLVLSAHPAAWEAGVRRTRALAEDLPAFSAEARRVDVLGIGNLDLVEEVELLERGHRDGPPTRRP